MQRAKRVLLVAVLCLLCGSMTAVAGEELGPKLFKDIRYGMTKEQVKAQGKVVKLPNDSVDILAGTADVIFAGKKWSIRYVFEEGSLEKIALVTNDSTMQHLRAALSFLLDKGYVPLRVSNSKESFDGLAHKGMKAEEVTKRFTRVEQDGFRLKDVEYALVETKDITKAIQQASSTTDFFLLGDESVRGILLKGNGSFVSVTFEVPKLALKKLEARVKSAGKDEADF